MITETGQVTAPRHLAIGSLSSTWPVVAIGYLIAYVLLDWASYIYPYTAFGITPWNPPAGLSFALVLLFGRRYMPLLFVAPPLADLLVRGWPLPIWLEVATAFVQAGTYAGSLYVLTTTSSRFDASLVTVRDVTLLLAVAGGSAAVAATAYVGCVVSGGALPSAEFWPAALRFWIGDLIGIAILTPFLLVLRTGRLSRAPIFDSLAQGASIILMVSLVFWLPASPQLQLLYLLFLPIIGIALRSGFEQTTVGLVLTQISLVAAVQIAHEKAGTVTSFQILLLCLAVTGLIMGAVVSQQRRAERQLRLQQEALAKVARIGSMGALGAAIAHEINQPLSAIATYADIVQSEIAKLEDEPPLAAEAARKTIAQVNRASDIVRKMRDLVRLGQSEAGPYAVQQIVDETKDLLEDDMRRNHIRLQVILAPDLPAILVDRTQIEQVLVNLIRNAVEAIPLQTLEARAVTVQAAPREANLVELSVHDSGPGIPDAVLADDVLPLASTKPDGLGLGLMICRTIVEAHGGRLWIDRRGPGGIVRFTVKAVI